MAMTEQKTGTPPSVTASRNKIAAKKDPEAYAAKQKRLAAYSRPENNRPESYAERNSGGARDINKMNGPKYEPAGFVPGVTMKERFKEMERNDKVIGILNEHTRSKGDVTRRKEGGVVKMKEGSVKDMREDKAMAKKSGMTMKKWEKSAADKKHDAPNKMAKGGVVKKAMGGTADPAVVARMTQGRPPVSTGAPTGSGSRRVAFEGPNDGMPGMRSGPPKPNMGPMPPRRPMGPPIAASTSSTPSTPTAVDPRGMKKGGGVEKKAKGGMVRGAGCAVRGKTGAKEY